MLTKVGRPAADEFAPYYGTYIDKVTGDDPVAALAALTHETAALLRDISEAKGGHRYAPGKWSVKEVIGHVTDAERVFGFRALWFARGDAQALPGFDENAWTPAGHFDGQSMADITIAWRTQREASLAMLRSFTPEMFKGKGVASGKPVSVRALAFIMAGHERHHVGVLHERYGL